MKMRSAFLLALPVTVVLQSNVFSQLPSRADTQQIGNQGMQSSNLQTSNLQSSQAESNDTTATRTAFGYPFGLEHQVQVASLVPGLPIFPVPSHPLAVPTIIPSTHLNTPGEKPNPGGIPFIGPVRPSDNDTSKLAPATKVMRTNRAGNMMPQKKKKVDPKHPQPKTPEDEIKYVALTFDDGPNPNYTPKVLAILKKEGIHATFCLIGRHAKKYPELVRQIVADGNQIADHSMNHDEHLDQRSDKKMQAEIVGTQTLLQSIVPGTAVTFYRAPAGNMDLHQRGLVKAWGMKPLGWSVDTKDWQQPGVDEILSTVQKQIYNGGIILMHDAGGNRDQTLEALEKVIPQLKKQGYQFVFPG
jgi:peptidoglycan/xylan/chitin deacetylase (PgdA/CDA1 family)